jgi:hypothetical protein
MKAPGFVIELFFGFIHQLPGMSISNLHGARNRWNHSLNEDWWEKSSKVGNNLVKCIANKNGIFRTRKI